MAYDTAKDGDWLATAAKDGDCSATGANCPATGAEDCGCPVTASEEGGEYMDGDGWSFGACWVLPTKPSGIVSNSSENLTDRKRDLIIFSEYHTKF
jgi:hypothetical protein